MSENNGDGHGGRIELPNDQWAIFRDPQFIGVGKRRELAKAMGHISDVLVLHWAVKDGDEEMLRKLPRLSIDDYATLWDVTDTLITILVESWSFPFACTVESLVGDPPDAVDAATHDALAEATKPYVSVLLPDFEMRLNPKTKKPDPDGPTSPSEDSAPFGRDSRTTAAT